MRIKRLLTPKEGPATSQLAAVTLLGIVIAATGLCIGTAARAQAQNQNKNQPTPTQTQPPQPKPLHHSSVATQYRPPQTQPPTNNQLLATHNQLLWLKLAPSVPPAPKPQLTSKRATAQISRVSYSPAPAPQSPSADPRPPMHVASGVMAGQGVLRVNPTSPARCKDRARRRGAVASPRRHLHHRRHQAARSRQRTRDAHEERNRCRQSMALQALPPQWPTHRSRNHHHRQLQPRRTPTPA